MEGSRRNSLSVPPRLVLLSFLIINTLPSSSPLPTKCFVCTHEDPGCEDHLTSFYSPFAKDCEDNAGCQIVAGVFDYPSKTYFYRDCLYWGYLNKCHKGYLSPGAKFNFVRYISCLNSVRTPPKFPHHETDSMPDVIAIPTTELYFLPGHKKPSTLYPHINAHLNQNWDLNNGVRIADIVAKQPKPDDFKVDGAFSCHSCDTQTGKCGGENGENIGDLPQQQCQNANGDAMGCMTLYSVNGNRYGSKSTRWMRRGCWYRGDLFCLTLNLKPCPAPPKKNCNARELIMEGETVYWEGERELARKWNQTTHEILRNCLKYVRRRLGVSESLPELPKFEDARPLPLDGSDETSFGLLYSFCAGRTLCNDKKTKYVQGRRTSGSPTSLRTDFPTEGDEECVPVDPDCVCEGDCTKSKDHRLLVVGAIVVIPPIAMLVGLWLFSKRRERVEPGNPGQPAAGGNPVTSYPPQRQPDLAQSNPNSSARNYQPVQQDKWKSNGKVNHNPPAAHEGLFSNSSSSTDDSLARGPRGEARQQQGPAHFNPSSSGPNYQPLQQGQWNSNNYPPPQQDPYQFHNSNSSMTDDSLARWPRAGAQ